MNTRTLLRGAAEQLRKAGVPDPEYDSALLLENVMGIPHLRLRLGDAPEPTWEQQEAWEALLARREKREPLQYILGSVCFCGQNFRVRPGVLIPRPETELLALWAAEKLEKIAHPKVLDLCCGSGCLGLSLKALRPNCEATLTDLSPQAVRLSQENREALGLRAEVLQGDLFAAVAGRTFDLIISNPPYIPSEECDTLQAEVLQEPRLALDGGRDGMDFYRRIAENASSFLQPGGLLMLEVGNSEAAAVREMCLTCGAKGTVLRKDDAGIERMVCAEF